METSLSAKRVVVCDPDAVQVIREFLEPLGVTVEFAPEEDLVPADPHDSAAREAGGCKKP